MLENIPINNSKLYRIFGVLDQNEVRQFELWLDSPLHNSSEENKKLFIALRSKRRKAGAPIKKLDLLCSLHGNRKFSGEALHPEEDKKLRKAMHNLCLQLEHFLIWKEGQKRANERKRLLTDSLMWRKRYDLLPRIAKQMKGNLEKVVQQNHQYYFENFLLEEMTFFQHMTLKNRDPNDNLQEVMDAARQLFLSKFLLYEAAAIDRAKILNKEYEHGFLPYVENFLKQHPRDLEQPLIKALYYVLLFVKEENGDFYFDALKSYLLENATQFDTTDLRMISNFLLNYCNRKIKEGHASFRHKKHEIYCMGVDNEIWSAGIYFSKTLFIQIIQNALKLEEYNWTTCFVKEQGLKLAPKKQGDTILFAQALSAFSQEDYLAAKNFIPLEKRETDLFDLLVYKILALKIDFEISFLADNDSVLTSKLETIYQVIKRDKKLPKSKQKMTERLRTSYANFVKFFQRIRRRKEKPKGSLTKEDIRKLCQEIIEIDYMEERDWLLEKVRKLR